MKRLAVLESKNKELREELEKLHLVIDGLKKELDNAKRRSDDEIKEAFRCAFRGVNISRTEIELGNVFVLSSATIQLSGNNANLIEFVRNLEKEVRSR